MKFCIFIILFLTVKILILHSDKFPDIKIPWSFSWPVFFWVLIIGTIIPIVFFTWRDGHQKHRQERRIFTEPQSDRLSPLGRLKVRSAKFCRLIKRADKALNNFAKSNHSSEYFRNLYRGMIAAKMNLKLNREAVITSEEKLEPFAIAFLDHAGPGGQLLASNLKKNLRKSDLQPKSAV